MLKLENKVVEINKIKELKNQIKNNIKKGWHLKGMQEENGYYIICFEK